MLPRKIYACVVHKDMYWPISMRINILYSTHNLTIISDINTITACPNYDIGIGMILIKHRNPRAVLEIPAMHVPRSLGKALKRGVFDVRLDTAFDEVVASCARAPRHGQSLSFGQTVR